MALTHTDLHLRQQQQHAAGRHRAYHHLQRPADTGEHTADLTQDGADIQQTDGVGNSRFSWVNIAGPLSQRKLVSQLCGCPSSAPAGKIKKKFGRRLSQSTLRTLLTFALNSGYRR